MTDLTITAANVVAAATAKKLPPAPLGEVVTAGMTLYRKSSDGKLYKCDCDSATAEERTPGDYGGIACNGGGVGQPCVVAQEGDINLGATLVVGEIYVVSDTPGGIMPEGDLEAGDYVTVLGVASSASNLKLKINSSGAAVPA